jgi:hypothetical protein
MEEIPIVFLQITNKIVLICTKNNQWWNNYSDYILYYYNNKRSQAPCEYSSTQIRQALTKATKVFDEWKEFWWEFELYFNSLSSNADGLPILNVQIIEKVKISWNIALIKRNYF